MLDGACVLLTGATGRFGRRLAEELAGAGCDLVLIVRARSPEAALERVRALLVAKVRPKQLTVVCGDLCESSLGLSARERRRLLSCVDLIVHAAATTSFTAPLHLARMSNVVTTHNMLEFALRAPRLSRFAHVSTAFVAGKRTGRILETELEHRYGFLNTYQRSKYEAELLLGLYRHELPCLVCRPSVILDNQAHRQTSAFRFAFELVRRGHLPAVPGTTKTRIDLVTETDAARTIARLLCTPDADGTYHVASGAHAVRLQDIVEPFGVRILPQDQFAWEVAKWRRTRPRLASVYEELVSFIFELAYPKEFDTRRVEGLLGAPVTREDPLTALLGEAPERRAAAGSAVGTS